MSNDMAVVAVALGRVLLGGLFVIGGVHHFSALDPLTQVLKGRGLPAPRFCLIVGSIFQTIAGALLIFGQFVQLAALGLVVFTLVASVLMVNFWSLTGQARESLKNVFMSNLAIIGGLLIAAATATH
jgi:putative oxidoreductase